MAYPTPRSSGDLLADMLERITLLERRQGRSGLPAMCRVLGGSNGWSTAQTAFIWTDVDAINPADMFDPATPTRITIPQSGIYQISYNLLSTGVIAANTMVTKNGAATAEQGLANAAFGTSGAGTAPAVTGFASLVAGDYLEVKHQSPSTGSGLWNPAGSSFSARRVGQS